MTFACAYKTYKTYNKRLSMQQGKLLREFFEETASWEIIIMNFDFHCGNSAVVFLLREIWTAFGRKWFKRWLMWALVWRKVRLLRCSAPVTEPGTVPIWYGVGTVSLQPTRDATVLFRRQRQLYILFIVDKYSFSCAASLARNLLLQCLWQYNVGVFKKLLRTPVCVLNCVCSWTLPLLL